MTLAELAEHSANRPPELPRAGRLVALDRPTDVAMLYVIKYEQSVVKVGVTADFMARVAAHDRSAPRTSRPGERYRRASRLAHFVTRPFSGARVAERHLVKAARILGTPLSNNHRTEWVRIRDVTPLLVLAVSLAQGDV
jgi:predicted GIY-YIG superfamily endonuclease